MVQIWQERNDMQQGCYQVFSTVTPYSSYPLLLMKRKYFYSKCASSEQDNKHEKITPVVSYPDKRFAYLSCWPLTVTLSCKFNQTDVCLMAAILLLNHYVGVLWVIQLQKWIYQFTQVSLLVMYCIFWKYYQFLRFDLLDCDCCTIHAVYCSVYRRWISDKSLTNFTYNLNPVILCTAPPPSPFFFFSVLSFSLPLSCKD